jgi:GTPase SAR1 family protein
MSLLTIISIVATTAAVIVGILLWIKQGLIEEQTTKIMVLERELKETSERISILESFCSTVHTTEMEQRNVIVIGPRASGKSSIVTLWCKVDRLIESITPTVTFDVYDYRISGHREEPFFDSSIQVERLQWIKRSLRVLDYAGEDAQIPNAVETIAASSECTLIMVFNSEPGFENDNRRYFSRSLVERLNKVFNRTGFETESIKGIYVVFNKIDLYPDGTGSLDNRLNKVRNVFADNIANIESIFGVQVKYMVTSATTNHNIVNLLQNVVRSYGD